jgi:hypothetical protein
MFVVAASFVSGKQEQVAFRQAMNNANQQIQGVINSVVNGEFTSETGFSNSFTCSTPGTGSGAPQINPATNTQGSNSQAAAGGNTATGCTFLGKVVAFQVGTEAPTYTVYAVAARQYAPGPVASLQQPPVKFSDAQPVLVTPYLDAAATFENQLHISKIFYCRAADANCSSPINSSVQAIGIFGSFTGGTAATSTTGAQTITPTYYTHSAPGDLNVDLPNSDATVVSNSNYLLLCLTDGGKYGSISIGDSNGQQTTTSMHILINIPTICPS